MQQVYYGLRDALLSREALFAHAREIALEATTPGNRSDFMRLGLDEKRLTTAHLSAAQDTEDIAAQWLLDHFHVLEQVCKELEGAWQPLRKLPRIAQGPFAGLPRVYRVAADMTGHHEGQLDEQLIVGYLRSYQEESILTMDELWALRTALQTALIKLCSLLAVECLQVRACRKSAEENALRLYSMKPEEARDALRKLPLREPEYVERLCSRMREWGGSALAAEELARMDTDELRMAQAAHRQQLRRRLLLGNAITSIRLLGEMDWENVFRAISKVDEILEDDPVFRLMDTSSRCYYRDCVTRLARRAGVSESAVARGAQALAGEDHEGLSPGERARQSHVGWYLCSGGRPRLLHALRPEMGKGRKSAFGSYLVAVSALTALFLLLAVWAGGGEPGDWWGLALALLPGLVCAWSFSQFIIQRLLTRLPVRRLPRLELKEGIPDAYRTLVAVPVLAGRAEDAAALAGQLERHYLACRGGRNLFFALLCDLPGAPEEEMPGDGAVLEALRARIAALNAKYPAEEPAFYVLTRRRRKNAEGVFEGWERKRGALVQLNALLLEGKREAFYESAAPEDIRFVVTLDADTRLPLDSVRKLVGTLAHPLNLPEFDDQGMLHGHAVIVPRMEETADSAAKTGFSRLFAGISGLDAYSSAVSETYQDLFGEGNYGGKGIYDVRAFTRALTGFIPENAVLSHDLLEGCYAGAAYASDIVLYDGQIARYLPFVVRLHRWTRGDWQLLPFALGGAGLSPLHRYKLVDNLRASLLRPSAVLLFLLTPWVPGAWCWNILALFALFCGDLLCAARLLLVRQDLHLRIVSSLGGMKEALLRILFSLCVLPYEAVRLCDAIGRAFWRTFVSHTHMLEWKTAADSERDGNPGLSGHYRSMCMGPVLGTAAIVSALLTGHVLMIPLGILWWLGPYAAWKGSKPRYTTLLREEDADFLRQSARQTWEYFAVHMSPARNDLPPDNVQVEPRRPVAERTSPTNIGMGLLAPYAAFRLQLIGEEEMLSRTQATLSTVERMEKWNGHLYNWYDTQSLAVLRPRFVSTVDSGNLAASLFALREALLGFADGRAETLAKRVDALLSAMDFSALYDRERKLFYIGFDAQSGEMNGAHYDLLASEARLTSFCAIAKGDVEGEHWFRLARPLTVMEGNRLLISWSGTMFEYLMPVLFTGLAGETLLDESVRGAVAAQRAAGKGKPWGISESGYYAFDLNMNYQYRAFGLPGMGVKPAREDWVIAPYATALAAMIDPGGAADNLRKLQELGAQGQYGFYEAVDFTPERVSSGQYRIVKSFMAHHQGMSLLSLCNVLCGGAVARAFLGAPEVAAVNLLLQERLPERSIVMKEYNRALPKAVLPPFDEVRAHVILPRGSVPQVCPLSGGISVLAFSDGRTGASWEGVQLYRSDYDGARGAPGCAMYVKTREGGFCASQGDAVFETEKVVYQRTEGTLSTQMAVCSAPEQKAELRLLTVTNHGGENVEFTLYGYVEVSLCTREEYAAHKAFHKLFVESGKPDGNTLTFSRRPRRGGEPRSLAVRWCAGGQPQSTNSRFSALGRNGNSWEPAFLRQGMEPGFEQVPLDPCALFAQSFCLEPGNSLKVGMAVCVGMGEEAQAAAMEYNSLDKFDAEFSLAWSYAQVRAKYLGTDGPQLIALRRAFTRILAPLPPDGEKLRALANCTLSRKGLWRLGISGDHPICLLEVGQDGLPCAREAALLYQYAQMCDFRFDLVVLDTEQAGYDRPVLDQLRQIFPGVEGIFILDGATVQEEEKVLLRAVAALRLSSLPFARQFPQETNRQHRVKQGKRGDALALPLPKLEHWNGWGGFDGMDYVIRLNGKTTPLPWSNILAEEGFGAIVTESGGGYTWSDNSAEHKLTPLANDPVADTGGELLLAREEGGAFWSLLPAPLPAGEYLIRHGFGFTRFSCGAEELYQECSVFVQNGVKCYHVELRNPLKKRRSLSLYFCAEWVLAQWREKANLVYAHRENGMLLASCAGEQGVAFVCAPAQPGSSTCSRAEFFGQGNGGEIAALAGGELSGKASGSLDACAALRVPVTVEAGERVCVDFLIGWAENPAAARMKADSFVAQGGEAVLAQVREKWRERLGALQVRTGDRAFDRMMNGWLLYQVYSSRLLAKAGYYQAGGATGFRDQLQDTLALLPTNPGRTRAQILHAAAHQFEDGDVQHWWHEPARGVRTYISDDLLFLPYVALAYVDATGDGSIWEEEAPFLANMDIPSGVHDIYAEAQPSGNSGTLYEHCLRAIRRASRLGSHGLPLMGTGDWNDGMDQVGAGGKGESVFLAWFLCAILPRFSALCAKRGDGEEAAAMTTLEHALRANLEKHGWDGQWYRRAFFDDGTPLGSAGNSECSIDAISQAWSVLAGGPQKRSRKAMEAVWRRLVDEGTGIIKLLDPPFANQLPRAGYIQGYLPGLRENGGQYTHAAAWVVLAVAGLGDLEGAARLWSMVNPIRHGDNPIVMSIYQGEPYVMAGDVYAGSHPGRAGWSWYTGSAAWMYCAGLALAGITMEQGMLKQGESAPQLGEVSVQYRPPR